MKRNKFIIALVVLLIGIKTADAQCFIKSTDQSSGHITYYLDAEIISQTDEMGLALSVQMVGSNYYLALTYQFSKKAVPLEEKVGIELVNGYTLELDMYTMQVGNANGVEMTMAVYNMAPELFDYFTKSDLKMIHFNTLDGKPNKLAVTKNAGTLKRQLKCFGK